MRDAVTSPTGQYEQGRPTSGQRVRLLAGLEAAPGPGHQGHGGAATPRHLEV